MTPLRVNDIITMDDREHVLHRPTIYIGSVTEEKIPTYVYTAEGKIEQKELLQIPGLCKIIDEIVDNAVDEAIRTQFKFATNIRVDFKDGTITVRDTGRGLPIEQDVNGKWTPEIVYTQLRAGSNFDDTNRQTLGMNGVGSALTLIMSKYFEYDTANGAKRCSQRFENAGNKIGKPKVQNSNKNYTIVKFTPNYDYFKASEETILNLPILIEKRLKNLAFAFPEICFNFNGTKIIAKNLKTFLTHIHPTFELNEIENARIGIFYSDTDFQQISFVNGLETKRGGTHINYITSIIVNFIHDFIKKKYKFDVKPIEIRSKLFLMLSMRMNNSQFDGQTKERLMNNAADFRTLIDTLLSPKFLKNILKNEEIIEPIVEAYRLKCQVKENIDLRNIVKKKKQKIEKFFPASGEQKYLCLTEGDSACGSLMPVLGRKEFSFFALRGKPLNTHEVSIKRLTENEEIKNIINILDLDLTKKVQDNMTHQNIILAADNDLDGQHIKGLLIAFFNRFTPSVIKQGQIKFLRTPLVTGKKKGKIEVFFFTMNEYKEYLKTNKDNKLEWHYYKGLGSWPENELKDLFDRDGIDHFLQTFEWNEETNKKVDDWLGRGNADIRKDYIRAKELDIASI